MVGVLGIWRREARSLQDRTELAATLFDELAPLPPDDDHADALALLTDEWTLVQLEGMALGPARSTLETARASAQARGDDIGAIQSDVDLSMLAVLEGHVGEGLDSIARGARAAQRAGYESTGVTAYRNAATLAVRTMEYGRAEAFLAEGMRYADAIEQSHCLHVMGAASALVAWTRADWDVADATGRQSIADHGCRRALTMARWAVGFVALGRGESGAAEAELVAALAVGRENGSLELTLPPLWGLAEVALQVGDPDLAMERCQAALQSSNAVGERALLVPFVVTGVRAGLAAGRPEDAEGWLTACADQLTPEPQVARAVAPALDHGRGLVALASGATGVARVALEGAVAGWDERGRIWEGTWARLDLAYCLARTNRFADAVGLATDARAVASRLDSRPLADRADTVLRMARGHVADEEPWRPLTAREYAVARLVSDGLTNGEIATELGIAPKTASSHIEHILAKLGASRRAEIAAWASRVGPSPSAR